MSKSGGFELGDYNDVASRLAEFREKHPEGSLQPVDPAQPYRIEQIGNDTFIVAVVAAYRTPDDTRPGIGMAQEAYPGKTPYTRGSEIQNAETSAWGRAIVAALAADTRKGVASAEEVRARRHEHAQPVEPANGRRPDIVAKANKAIAEADTTDALQKIGRYISTLVDSGDLNDQTAIQLRRALVARLDELAGVELIIDAQSKRLHTLLGKAGVRDRDEKLRLVSQLAGRDIASTGELTRSEAKQVMDMLEAAGEVHEEVPA